MTPRWTNILILLLASASLIFAGCSHNYSTDNPLPTNYNPSVIINSDNMIMYGLNPANGTKNWQVSFTYLNSVPNTDYMASPLVYNGSLYIVFINSDTLYKVSSRTGAIEQKITLSGESFSSEATPVADGDKLYLACSNGKVYCIDTSGNSKWQYNTGAGIESSPTVHNGQVFVANMGGHVVAIDKVNGPDPSTGNPTWDWPGIGNASGAKFISSVSIGDPYLYVGSVTDSNMYCIYQTTPTPATTPPNQTVLRWTFKTNGAIYSSPASYGGYCIFGCTDYYIYCLDTSIRPFDPIAPFFTPRVYWKFRTNSRVFSSPYAYNQVIYVGSDDEYLYALNIIDGSMKWKYAANGLIKSSPVVYSGSVYVGSYDKSLHCVDSATGTKKWSVGVNGTVECSPVIDDLRGDQYNSQISGLTN